MGRFLMPVRDRDEPQVDDWVEWSTVVDAPTMRGNRDDMIEYWDTQHVLFPRETAARMDAAERDGSTGMDGLWGDELRVMEGQPDGTCFWVLPRAKLRAYCDLVFTDEPATDEQLRAVLRAIPFED